MSMLLTAIATAGIIALYLITTRASGYSRRTTEATVLAQDQIERLRTSSVMAPTPVTETALDERGTPASGVFDRISTVIAGPPGPTGRVDFDDVVVSVRWNEDGTSRTVTLRTRRNR